MGAEKNLIVKTGLSGIKVAQADLVDNLYAHVNASLSVAHGINLCALVAPATDAYGNEIAQYYDVNGDVVGYRQMVLTYNNTLYYAPVNLTDLPGKDPMTGISSTLNVATVQAPAGVAWVTDFTSEIETELANTNNDVLLPHANQAHWEAHTVNVFQIVPQQTLDSAGHVVGTHVARLAVDGQEMQIVCTPRMGGPAQYPRITNWPTPYIRLKGSHPGDNLQGKPFQVVWAGTRPATVKWLISVDNVTFEELPTTVPPNDGETEWTGSGWPDGWRDIKYLITTTDAMTTHDTLELVHIGVDENRWRHLYLYAQVTNGTGVTGLSQLLTIDILNEGSGGGFF